MFFSSDNGGLNPSAAQLFDFYADPREERDLATTHLERVAEMTETARAWPRLDRPGETTILNLLFDPDGFGGPEDRDLGADVAKRRAERID